MRTLLDRWLRIIGTGISFTVFGVASLALGCVLVPVLTVVTNNRNYQTVRLAYARYDGKMKAANRFTGMHLGDPDIDFAGLARSQGVGGEKVETSADLVPAIRRGIAATRAGEPYLLDVVVDRKGAGGDSTWHQRFNLAEQRAKKV